MGRLPFNDCMLTKGSPVVEESSEEVPSVAEYELYVDVIRCLGNIGQVALLSQVGRHLQQCVRG